MKPSELRMFLNKLCELAKAETLPRFRVATDITNKRYDHFDPVTEADQEAERVIREEISKNWPDHGIIGEELGTKNPNAEYQWIIDPIDGTRSFITGIPLWGTLIGFYHNDRPIAGVLDQPFTNERFICDGETSTLAHGDNASVLKTRQTTDISHSLLMTTAPEYYSGESLLALERLKSACRLTRYGADCYAFGMLASGNVDLVMESDVQFYDIAGLIPIIEMAGGVFSDWQGNRNPRGGNVIAAANKNLHEEALALIKG